MTEFQKIMFRIKVMGSPVIDCVISDTEKKHNCGAVAEVVALLCAI